jgi:hypothetical protein
MQEHANAYGNNYDINYFNLLFQLYQQYINLEGSHGSLESNIHALFTYFFNELHEIFMNEYTNNFLGTFQIISDNIQYSERITRLNLLIERVNASYTVYINTIQTVEALLQQVRTINTDFTLPLNITPIEITPTE